MAVMSILIVTRHTRGDEEAGRIEMIRSLPVKEDPISFGLVFNATMAYLPAILVMIG